MDDLIEEIELVNQTPLIKFKLQNNKFDIQEFNKFNCSVNLFGKTLLEQEVYYCLVCDPNRVEPVCYECYTKCHNSCNKTNLYLTTEPEVEYLENNEKITKEIFICSCGLSKHILDKPDKVLNQEFSHKCLTYTIDKVLMNDYVYKCSNCYIDNLCFLCYKKCLTVKTKVSSSRLKMSLMGKHAIVIVNFIKT